MGEYPDDIKRQNYPEYDQDLIDPDYNGEERRKTNTRPRSERNFIYVLMGQLTEKMQRNRALMDEFPGFPKRIDDIIKTAGDTETTEYYFSIDSLPYFQAQIRMLMSKGLIPTIRMHSKDRYGIPVWPIDEEKMEPENLPQGAFISLVKCPEHFRACNFIPPLDTAKVKEAADKGKLGFTDKFSHTTHISVATVENGSWNGPIVIPNTTYECYPLEQIKQYGTGLFEGMGVEKTENGQVVIFRLDEHIKRMYEGGKIYDMFPDLKTEEDETRRFEKFKDLYTRMTMDVIRANWQYIPAYGKGRLYIRPNFFDHGEKMHADVSGKFMMLITAIPIGSAESYFKSGEKVFFMVLKRSRTVEHSREGMAKAVGHYAFPARLLHKAAEKNMAGVIYTNRKGNRVEETHASSVLFIITMKDGSRKIMTPSLHHGTILDSVTRKTSLVLAANELGWKTEERQINPLEILLYSTVIQNPALVEAIKTLMEKAELDETEKMLEEHMSAEEIKKIMPTLQKLAKNIANGTGGGIKKEHLAIAENIESIEAVAAGTGAALASIHQIQMGEADRMTDDIEEKKYQELIVLDHKHTGEMGPASKELFNLLLSIKSGKFQKELRKKLADADGKDKTKIEEKLKEYEAWLTLIPPPEKIIQLGQNAR